MHPAETEEVLAFYATPGCFTTLPSDSFSDEDIHRVVDVVRGLLIYDVVAQPFYGVELGPDQLETIHERDTARLLATVRAIDARPLDEARPPGSRVGARCHVFSRLTVAFLRAAGVPARARCGFGAYFRPGWYEDHWVAEYWNAREGRWQMVDAQIDATWRKMLDYSGDDFDVSATEFPHGRRRVAGVAARGSGRVACCGLSGIDEHGAHWIAGNLRLDFASLNKVEMLPWDVWGAGWAPGGEPTNQQLAFFDGVAELTMDMDGTFRALRERYDTDADLRVSGEVFNVLRGRLEAV